MKLRVGDTVMVIAGASVGKESKIARVFPKTGKIIVENVATAKRHTRPSQSTMQGGIIDKDMPISASNVMIVCKKCGPTKIGFSVKDGQKVRVCRRCGEKI